MVLHSVTPGPAAPSPGWPPPGWAVIDAPLRRIIERDAQRQKQAHANQAEYAAMRFRQFTQNFPATTIKSSREQAAAEKAERKNMEQAFRATFANKTSALTRDLREGVAQARQAAAEAKKAAALAAKLEKMSAKERQEYIKAQMIEQQNQRAAAEEKLRKAAEFKRAYERGAARLQSGHPLTEPTLPLPGGVGKKGKKSAQPGIWQMPIENIGAFLLADPLDGSGIFDRIASGLNKGEQMTRKLRTRVQRLQTYGLWFVETAQHNPLYTAGKFMLNTMRLMAPPYGHVLATTIASIVSSGYVIPQTIRNMSRKGRPWNIDWRRAIEDEVVGMFSLEEQKRRDLGLHGVITDPTTGYQPVDSTEIYNNRTIADTVRLNKLTQEEKAGRYV